MIRLTALLANTVMGFFGQHLAIRRPKVAVTLTLLVGLGNLFPESVTGRIATVSDYKRHNLARASTQGSPEPALIRLFVHKRPHLIEFEYVVGFGGQKRRGQG